MEEFEVWWISSFGSVGALAVVFVANAILAPWRIERDRRKELEHELAALRSSTRKESPIVNLRPGKDIVFDCSNGDRFFFAATKHSVLQPPKNPREGTYLLYFLQPSQTVTLGYSSVYEIDLSVFPEVNYTPGSLTVLRIEILEMEGRLRHFVFLQSQTSSTYQDVESA